MHPILVVDDEQAIAMLIRRILTDAGYRCEAVMKMQGVPVGRI